MFAMFRVFVTILITVFTTFLVNGQQFWTQVDASKIQLRSESSRIITPERFKAFSLDRQRLASYLSNAPIEHKNIVEHSNFTVYMPDETGELAEYVVWYSPVMEEELAAKYPNIRSYKGFKRSDRSVSMRMTVMADNFYAAFSSIDKMVYIDQYSTENNEIFMAYNTADYDDPALSKEVICGIQDEFFIHETNHIKPRTLIDEIVPLRIYRLALGCSVEWGARRGTKEKALEEMVTFVDRANVYFEREVSARMVIVASNENAVNVEEGQFNPYTDTREGRSILTQNTTVLNQRIGVNNYDIGHVFSVCYDVGGVAFLGSICSQNKGAGVTCHNGTSISNGIVQTFVHEVGHQMSANHTFNHCPGNEGQTPSGTGFEPGSGSTIMAYPGACSTSNLGVPRDDYYHGGSLNEIYNYTATEGAEAYRCAQKVDLGNFRPVVTLDYTDGFFIPRVTPFYLTGKAEDANGDNMTFNWEEMDSGTSSPLGMPAGNAPIFRSLRPGNSTTRFFPNTNRILQHEFNHVHELLPTYGRDLTFRLVARDNHPMGSAAGWEEVKFKVAPNSGPFEMLTPNEPLKLKAGDKVDVTWDVSNTDIAPVNCKYVDIYFALDSDLDFDGPNMILAATQVPNDGHEAVIVPNVVTPRTRIVVKASNNIFFTLTKEISRIDAPTEPSFFMDIANPIRTLCLPDEANFEITTVGFQGLEDAILFEIDAPVEIVATFSKDEVFPGESNQLNLNLDNIVESGTYEVVVRTFVDGIDTIERTLRLFVTTTDLGNIVLASPINGDNGVGPTQRYRWESKRDAVAYILQVATSPAFDPEDIVFETERQDTFFNSNTFLKTSTIYYWRVKSYNFCKDGDWSVINAFNTESKDCAITHSGPLSFNISQSGTPTITSEIYVSGEGRIDDVNVLNIRAVHQRASDLTVTLESPSGTQVKLWGNKCPNASGINVGVDDQSNDYFQCPIHQAKIYRPEIPLSTFNGETMNGYWKLIVADTKSGDGGRLQNWDLELCSNIVSNPPYLVNNEVMELNIGETKAIRPELLRSDDNDNGDDELIYTIVSAPQRGLLLLDGVPVFAGARFSQENINDGMFSYMATSLVEAQDEFKFTVSDGRGGWIAITTFEIHILMTSSTKDAINALPQVLVYPNPASDEVYIQSFEDHVITGWTLSNITGNTIKMGQESGKQHHINVVDLPKGMYLLRINFGAIAVVKKVVVK